MKRKTLVIAALTLILVLAAFGTAAAKQGVRVKVNGEVISFKVPPFIEKGRTLVPQGEFFDRIGATVSWDREKGSVTIEDGSAVIELEVNSNKARVSGKLDPEREPEEVQLDVGPKISDGNLFIPLRFAAERLGAKVSWDERAYMAVVEKDEIIPVERPVPFEVIKEEDIRDIEELAGWYEENCRTRGIHYKTVGSKTYVLICAGEKPTGGYSIEVESATMVYPGRVYITANVEAPAPDMMVIQVLTYPNVLIRLDESGIEMVEGDIAGDFFTESGEKDLKEPVELE